MSKKTMNPPFARVIGFLIALLLMLCTVLCGVSCVLTRLVTDRDLHLRTAESALPAQKAAVTAAVESAAKTYSFDPDPVNALLTEEELRAFNETAIDWWMTMATGDLLHEPPLYTNKQIEETIRADETFQAVTPSTERRTIARDKAQAEIERVLNRAVIPVRTDVIQLTVRTIANRYPITKLLPWLPRVPYIAGGAMLVLALLLLALLHRGREWLSYTGAAVLSGGLLQGALLGGILLYNVPAKVAEVSAIFAGEVTAVGSALCVMLGCIAGGCVLLGAVLMACARGGKA